MAENLTVHLFKEIRGRDHIAACGRKNVAMSFKPKHFVCGNCRRTKAYRKAAEDGKG